MVTAVETSNLSQIIPLNFLSIEVVMLEGTMSLCEAVARIC
jgi:hypothetical protein